ncbi:hypothetical protein CBW46_007385 [Paenibacillus xerothermodurans]|uniref:Uncharacterized protein n=1 Tax=Paenibacillus xerothermodurans TaxID=1977292 RepID=A0A2W1P225_PAEXE|nr:hypothetical protein CBW46_007385 [Paenibacillus xerothermodurans]
MCWPGQQRRAVVAHAGKHNAAKQNYRSWEPVTTVEIPIDLGYNDDIACMERMYICCMSIRQQ